MLVHSHFPDSTHINFLHWPLQVLQSSNLNGILKGILQQLEKFCPVFQFCEQKFNLKWLFSSSALGTDLGICFPLNPTSLPFHLPCPGTS